MDLIINGKPFSIEENMQKSLSKAISISQREICLEIYMQDIEDREYDAIIFLDSLTGEYEITYVKYIRKAINNPFFNFKQLFIPATIVKTSCVDIQLLDPPSLLSLDTKANLNEITFIPRDSTLFIYIPQVIPKPVNKPVNPEKSFLASIPVAKASANAKASLSKLVESSQKPYTEPKREDKPVEYENIYTKKFNRQERREALQKHLKITENIDVFNVPMMKKILRIDKSTGAASLYDIESLISNPNLGLESVDDLISSGVFKTSIVGKFNHVSCCDIRHAYRFFKDKETTVKGINYVINEDILYLVYAHDTEVSQGLTLKEFSKKTYSSYMALSEELLSSLEKTMALNAFYIYRNSLPDCVAICNENDDTSSIIELSAVADRLEKYSYEMNTDISVLFPIDKIIDLNEYGVEELKAIRHGTMKSLNACDIKAIREEDGDMSIGYDKKNNTVFYCKPRY